MKKIFYAACAAASIIACTKAETSTVNEGTTELTQQGSAKQITIVANLPGTKVSFTESESDGSIKPAWSTNDPITVFADASSLSTFTASEDGASAAFTGSATVNTGDSLFAVYPSTSDFVYDFSNQGGTLESAAAIAPMYGATVYKEDVASDVSEINFHNAATIVKVQVTVPSALDVTYLVISTSDNSLVNKATMDKNGKWSNFEYGDITVKFDEAQSVEAEGVLTAYVVVVPHTTTAALKVAAYDAKYQNLTEQKGYFVKTSSDAVEFEKGKVQSLTKTFEWYDGVAKYIDTNTSKWNIVDENPTQSYSSEDTRYLVDALLEKGSTYTYVVLPNATSISDYAFVYKNSSGSFAYINNLVYISAPEVTSIGACAFQNSSSYSRLVYALFPKATSIGQRAFYSCDQLKYYDFSSVETIGQYAFQGCSRLTSLDFPKCTSAGNYAFMGCSSATSANLPELTALTASLFYECSGLTSLNFPKVTKISGSKIFYSCSKLTSLTFGSVITSATSYIESSGSSPFYKNISQNIDLTLANGQSSLSSPALDVDNKTFAKCTFKSINVSE